MGRDNVCSGNLAPISFLKMKLMNYESMNPLLPFMNPPPWIHTFLNNHASLRP